jgi:hypothetical protein
MGNFVVLPAPRRLAVPIVLHLVPTFQAKDSLVLQTDVLKLIRMLLVTAIVFL